MTQRDRVPSFFILVPGPWRTESQVVDLLAARGVDATASGGDLVDGSVVVTHIEDEHLDGAFQWGRLGMLDARLTDTLAGCPTAALLEVGTLFQEAAALLVATSEALRDAGGLAVRVEASGGAWAWEPWLERLQAGDPWALYECATVLVQDDDGALCTCGMHAFDLPDATIRTTTSEQSAAWLDVFSAYQIGESPVLGSGHTFRPDEDHTRRAFERWPDHLHHPDDGRHNPFGVWRFLEVGAETVEASNSVPKIIPSLAAMLTAAERSAGRPLTQAEVQARVAQAPAISMALADANALDRSRGYADIEPELAWEQWQIVRRHDSLAR